MKVNNSLVVVIVYPEAEKYLQKYFESLILQAKKCFDLLIVNDGVPEFKAPEIDLNVHLKNIDKRMSVAEIRQSAIDFAVEKDYENIIFTDVDDYFNAEKIEFLIKKLERADFVFNEMDLVDIDGHQVEIDYLASLGVKQEYASYKDILDFNIFGLSNTAIKVECLKLFRIPKNIVAVDWWLFTMLLINGKRGCFVDSAKTYYRQHENNIIGAGRLLTKNKLIKILDIKISHYKSIVEYALERKDSSLYSCFSNKLNQMLTLQNKFKDSGFVKQYVNVINKNMNNIFKGWWSQVIALEEWRKYVG